MNSTEKLETKWNKRIAGITVVGSAILLMLIGAFRDELKKIGFFMPENDPPKRLKLKTAPESDGKETPHLKIFTPPPPAPAAGPKEETDPPKDDEKNEENGIGGTENGEGMPIPLQADIEKLQELCSSFLYEELPQINPYQKNIITRIKSILINIQKGAMNSYGTAKNFDLPALCGVAGEALDQRIDEWILEIANSELSLTEKFKLFRQTLYERSVILEEWLKEKEIEELGDALENEQEEVAQPVWHDAIEKAGIVAGPGGFETDPSVPKYETLLEEKDFYKNVFAAMKDPALDAETAEYLIDLWNEADDQIKEELEKEFGDEFEEVMERAESVTKISQAQKDYQKFEKAMIEYKTLFEEFQISTEKTTEDEIELLQAKKEAYWAVDFLLIHMTTGRTAITPEEANIPYSFDQLYDFMQTFELTKQERDKLLNTPKELLFPD